MDELEITATRDPKQAKIDDDRRELMKRRLELARF
jgi:hypothetical protein